MSEPNLFFAICKDQVTFTASRQKAEPLPWHVLGGLQAHSHKAGDQYSSREQEAGPSQPIDMALPAHVLGNVPSVLGRPAAVMPARPSAVSGKAYSRHPFLYTVLEVHQGS